MALAYDVPFITAGQQPPLVKVGPTYRPGDTACLACHEAALRRAYPRYDELAEHRRGHPVADTTLGPASALIGGLLASDALHLLLDQEPATLGRSITVDLRTFATTSEPTERDPSCPACGVRAPRPSP
jgi:bacteriocin biosynthesis cyclodehydratase domain-containing protein